MFDRQLGDRGLNDELRKKQKAKTLQMFHNFFIDKKISYGVARVKQVVELSLSLWESRNHFDGFLPEDRGYVVAYLETICAGIKYLRLLRKDTSKLEIKLKLILRKYFQYLSLYKIYIAGDEDDMSIIQSECLLIAQIEILKIIRRYNVQYIFEEFIVQFKKDFVAYLGIDDFEEVDIFSVKREYPSLMVDLIEECYQYDIIDLDQIIEFLMIFFQQYNREDIEDDIERDRGLPLIGKNIKFVDWPELLSWLMDYMKGDDLRTYILENIFKFESRIIVAVLSYVIESVIISNSEQKELDAIAINKFLNSDLIKKYINGEDKPKDGFSENRIVEIRYLSESDFKERYKEEGEDEDNYDFE
jgi:hypothetical protein